MPILRPANHTRSFEALVIRPHSGTRCERALRSRALGDIAMGRCRWMPQPGERGPIGLGWPLH